MHLERNNSFGLVNTAIVHVSTCGLRWLLLSSLLEENDRLGWDGFAKTSKNCSKSSRVLKRTYSTAGNTYWGGQFLCSNACQVLQATRLVQIAMLRDTCEL